MTNTTICGMPTRIIPFDLGRGLDEKDKNAITKSTLFANKKIDLSMRQSALLKGVLGCYWIDEDVSCYIYYNGITVIVINDRQIKFKDNYKDFSVAYGINRKNAHADFFSWKHEKSQIIKKTISQLRKIVLLNSKKKTIIRESADESFENQGLSYIMTLSFFDINTEIVGSHNYKKYPEWLKRNIYALLDPCLLYLEDSNKFKVEEKLIKSDNLLDEVDIDYEVIDYEKHKNINAFMSWAAVVVIGELQDAERIDYTMLEVQLQSDWFFVYCIDKHLNRQSIPKKREIMEIQKQSYEIDLLENRLYDFDDSSMPTRILEIQKGLIETSGLNNSIQHLQRKIKYIQEVVRYNSELKQKRFGQSSEILLFVIAFIEIAPTVAEYGNRLYPNLGLIGNCVLVLLGVVFLIRKN